MAKPKKSDNTDPTDPSARLSTTPEDRGKAAKWFERARDLGGKRQFDYAIEYYIDGLAYWPDAVEEACKPLHGCAVARRQTGGKKPGLKDTMRRSLNDKDPKRALMNALWLFAHDPENAGYIDGVVRNASRYRAEDSAKWAGGILLKALESNPKATAKQFQTLAELLEQLADRATDREDGTFGVEVYRMGIETVHLWQRRFPKDRALEKKLKDLSTKLTILKGKYQNGESFRDSIADRDTQVDLHDEHRSMQAEDRHDELVAKAEEAFKQNPDDGRALESLINLLCRREQEEQETRAIGILVNEYNRTGSYGRKQAADNIRIKQLGRKVRLAAKAGDEQAAKQSQIDALRFELKVFRERVEKYPTDNRIKYDYAVRLFRAGRFDDAIPLFQGARSDPKNRAACGMYLGRCFFRKGYQDQAVSALEEAIAQHQFGDDDLAKAMRYWLGRAQEAAGKVDAARKSFGDLLQLDYNYGDVRARMDALPKAG